MGVQIWDIESILQEAKEFIEQYGELPGRKKLAKLKRHDFINAVNKYYPGNMTQLRIDLNAPTGQKYAGYWSKEKLISVTKKIIEKEGKFPTQRRLSELGYSTISIYAQRYFGGLHGLAIECGLEKENLWTKSGYWKDINNIKQEIELIIDKIGRFPTTSDLKLANKHNLLSAISTNFNGIKNVRKLLSYTKNCPIAKDKHFRDSFSEVIIDDFLFMNKIPHKQNVPFNFPGIKCIPDFVLENMTLIEVLMADYRLSNHKGWHKQYVTRYLKKRKAYLSAGMDVIEVFPDELINRKKLDIKLDIIAKKANAPKPYLLKDFTKIIFFDKKSPGYWSIPENLKRELLPLIKKYGRIPTIKTLREIGRNDIEGAIINIYGSYRSASKAIGLDYEIISKPQGYWKKIKNIKEELKPVIKKYGYLPGKTELKKIRKEGIVVAIETYYDSFNQVASILNVDYKPSKKTNGHWMIEENIKNELKTIIKEKGYFPSASDLRNIKQHGLLNGILNMYGSFRNAAIMLGFEIPDNKPKGYWKKKENVFNELDIFHKKYNCIPSCKIIEREKAILMYAIRNYHGGTIKIRNEYQKNRKLI